MPQIRKFQAELIALWSNTHSLDEVRRAYRATRARNTDPQESMLDLITYSDLMVCYGDPMDLPVAWSNMYQIASDPAHRPRTRIVAVQVGLLCSFRMGDIDRGRELEQLLTRIWSDEMTEECGSNLARCYMNLGGLARLRQDYGAALRHYRDAAAWLERFPAEHGTSATAAAWLQTAEEYARQLDLDKALDCLRRGVSFMPPGTGEHCIATTQAFILITQERYMDAAGRLAYAADAAQRKCDWVTLVRIEALRVRALLGAGQVEEAGTQCRAAYQVAAQYQQTHQLHEMMQEGALV